MKKRIFIVCAVIIVGIIISTAVYMWNNNNSQIIETGVIQTLSHEQSRILAEENNWNNNIVTSVTPDGIPIPNDFSYVSGNKETGIIVEDGESKYLFIPYEQNLSTDYNEYYSNVEYMEPESDVLDSIEIYNGFYVKIHSENSLDKLKDITDSEYKTLAQQCYNSYDSVNSNILSKEQINQIEYYLSNYNVSISRENIGVEALTIEKFAKLNINTTNQALTEDENNILESGYVCMVNGVPIPKGFKYNIDNGIVSIQDELNQNLIYIWVPVDYSELSNRKSELKSLYDSYTNSEGESFKTGEGSELYRAFNETTEELPQEYLDSISQYGGFYISEAELSYDKENNYYNKARGMIGYSATNTAVGGDYYRGNDYSYDTLVKIAENIYDSESAVVSHIMYGVEYDATVINIKDNNRDFMDSKGNRISTILLENSTYVGKYSNSNLSSTTSSEASSIFFNKIWGLGGNLEEITTETTANKLFVTRGGSYAHTGEENPIASRNIIDDISLECAGIRVSLYVKPNLPKVNGLEQTFKPTIIDDTIETINDIDFSICEESPIWTCNYDGAIVYESPDITSNELSTLPFATEVYLQSLANSKHNDILWAKVKLANGINGFISCSNLTGVKVTIDTIDFIKKGSVTRYYNKGLVIYDSPNTSSNIVTTTDCNGAIKVIGKSISQTWAIVEIDNNTYYTLASNLRVSAQTEEKNGYMFVLGMEDIKYVINTSGTNLLSIPDGTDVKQKLSHATEVTLLGVTLDRKYAKVSINSDTGYVLYNDLGSIKPEVSNDRTNEFLLDESYLVSGISLDPNYKGRKITDITEYEKSCILHMLAHEFGGDLTGCILITHTLRDELLLPKSAGGFKQNNQEHANVLTVLANAYSSHYCTPYTQCSWMTLTEDYVKYPKEAFEYVFMQGGSAIQHELLAYAATYCDFSYWPSHPYRVLRYNYTWYNGNVSSGYWWCWKHD